jgi:NADH-quinone oxidoreductase subunit L
VLHTAWVIPAFPLAGFILLVLFGSRLGDPKAGWLATAAAVGSFAFSVVVFIGLLGRAPTNRLFLQTLWSWVPVGGFKVDLGLQIDPLSVTMILFVTGVGSLIHLYSIGYMRNDPRFPRFFVYMNLFLLSMLMLVMGSNFLVTFLGWEGVGTCSYLLVSFWFEKDKPPSAGKKAFVTTRVGDWGFMIGIFLVFAHFGSINYVDVLSSSALSHIGQTTATWICLALFLGCVGKSAQLPLFVWLPDAMEGPTPVSALIHAATMVTAGVYLLCRISPMLNKAPEASVVIAVVGTATAFLAATIACAQNDIKKVLAYSTISQLGYMFAAVGAGAYAAGVFHMVTHAFFKALLFLGAGAVIHGMHDEQDMKRMGGLRRFMPITAITFIIAWLSISGVIPLAGFWSKDAIFAGVWAYHDGLGKGIYFVLLLTAFLTAYYMSREVGLVFFGRERWREPVAEPALVGAGDHPAADAPAGHEDAGHGEAEHGDPYEASWIMLIPLIVLAFGAFFGGVINLPWYPFNLLDRWLAPVVGAASNPRHSSTTFKLINGAVSTAIALSGIAVGLRIWDRSAFHPELEPTFLERGWFIDWLYAQIIERPGLAFCSFCAWVVDKRIIDGAVNGVGELMRGSGGQLRKLQTGFVRTYALGIAAGTVAILAYVVVRAS